MSDYRPNVNDICGFLQAIQAELRKKAIDNNSQDLVTIKIEMLAILQGLQQNYVDDALEKSILKGLKHAKDEHSNRQQCLDAISDVLVCFQTFISRHNTACDSETDPLRTQNPYLVCS